MKTNTRVILFSISVTTSFLQRLIFLYFNSESQWEVEILGLPRLEFLCGHMLVFTDYNETEDSATIWWSCPSESVITLNLSLVFSGSPLLFSLFTSMLLITLLLLLDHHPQPHSMYKIWARAHDGESISGSPWSERRQPKHCRHYPADGSKYALFKENELYFSIMSWCIQCTEAPKRWVLK